MEKTVYIEKHTVVVQAKTPSEKDFISTLARELACLEGHPELKNEIKLYQEMPTKDYHALQKIMHLISSIPQTTENQNIINMRNDLNF